MKKTITTTTTTTTTTAIKNDNNNIVAEEPKKEKTPVIQERENWRIKPEPINQETENAGSSLANGNGINRKIPKHKWVPLDIEISNKHRSKRERSPRPIRRSKEYDDSYYESARPSRNSARRVRGGSVSSYRGGRGTRGSTGRGGGIRRSAPRGGSTSSTPGQARSESDYADYPAEYTQVNKIGADAPAFMMPYRGTFYYNGTPSFVDMDSLSLKDCIQKQM